MWSDMGSFSCLLRKLARKRSVHPGGPVSGSTAATDFTRTVRSAFVRYGRCCVDVGLCSALEYFGAAAWRTVDREMTALVPLPVYTSFSVLQHRAGFAVCSGIFAPTSASRVLGGVCFFFL